MLAVKLTLNVAGDNGGGIPKTLWVQDSFDEVLEKILPITPPTSSLESRAKCTWTSMDGNPVLCSPHYIATAEVAEYEVD